MEKLEKIYGIKIDNTELFSHALTHSSYTNENKLNYSQNYERLEFLGDAVLKLIAAQILYEKYPHYDEGNLSKICSFLVSDAILSELANNIGLFDLIIIAKNEKKFGNEFLSSISGSVFEAVLGAYYLDGKFEQLKNFLKRTLTPYIEKINDNFGLYNSKALLQEYTQCLDKKLPEYNVIDITGPEHSKIFTVEVTYQNKLIGTGKGKNKKEAEQHAAYEACKNLGVI